MAEARALAELILSARDNLRRIETLAPRIAGFDVAAGYRVAAELRGLRQARGEHPVGRKIGFTNSGIWPEYGVYGPIWGEVYDTTLSDIAPGARISIAHLSQPRIEPEIVFGIERDLTAGMSIADIEASIAWVAHGFEIVQTVYLDWKFTAPDCIAEGGLHGLLLVGPRKDLSSAPAGGLATALSGIRLDLFRDGQQVDGGVGSNALGGPVQALKFLADGLAQEPSSLPVRKGEVITTGTLTRAFPIAAGESWSTKLNGFELPGLDVTFA